MSLSDQFPEAKARREWAIMRKTESGRRVVEVAPGAELPKNMSLPDDYTGVTKATPV
ncbi:hypothetical protein sS8_3548 [Methylocaldum marinum]|uniref:Uncharacterized protein n=1 Tax=Methylocaldum marinum TaxID=1432792 RepID=A0A250KV33_9GAMM|nr:hypothetical protein [Methylocaldum marinum]BBA35485.1 hypothetical protein sS8_3548 [Methylocaldum marinum]